MRRLFVLFGLGLHAAVAGPIYLLPPAPIDVVSVPFATAINSSGIIVGGCSFIDTLECYWDTNEAPVLFTQNGVTDLAWLAHPLDIIPCQFAGGTVLDIDDAGNILARADGLEGNCPGQSPYTVGVLPDFWGLDAHPRTNYVVTCSEP